MTARLSLSRRVLFRAAAALVAAAAASPVVAHWSPAPSGPVRVDVIDRVTGTPLTVHEKDGRHHVVGQPGREYAIRIRNLGPGRILAVTSVDGVNVVTGETASPGQSGYVIDGWGTVEIGGWRKSLSRTAAFFFTEHSASYAARTGRPFDVGVIGVAVFAERVEHVASQMSPAPRARQGEPMAEAAAAPQAPAPASESKARNESQDSSRLSQQRPTAVPPLARLGTGHGRSEVSHVREVAFRRATTEPMQIVAIEYDRRENLIARGVLPPERIADRSPRPFPGMRFVPDPR